MKYLKLYEKFRLIKESISGKKLILFSGPSASGKTYLATDPESKLSKKFKHWYENPNANEILIGTDTFMGSIREKSIEVLYKLMENYGIVKYTEVARTFPDQPWLIEAYDSNLYKKFREEASEEELKIWNEMNSQISYSVKNCTGSIKNQEDGRVCGMAWVAYLHPAKTIIFDDVDTAIKNYFPDLTDILCFTPFGDYLTNVKKRIHSTNPQEKIDVGDEGAGIYQYIQWFKAIDESNKGAALDNKFYTVESAKKLLEETGYKKSDEILKLLGVNSNSNGFYIGKKENVKCDQVINTRDESSVKSAKI